MQLNALVDEVKRCRVATERQKLEEVEQQYFNYIGGKQAGACGKTASKSLVSEIAETRKRIGDALKEIADSSSGHVSSNDPATSQRLTSLEKDNASLHQELKDLRKLVEAMKLTIDQLSGGKVAVSHAATAHAPATASKNAKPDADGDDDVDLFGSDEEKEDEEKVRVREERLKAYAAKKTAKPGPIAKSSVILDVKPWDDETDMKNMEQEVRKITKDGLVWGASKLVPVGYGIKKLQIMCVVEDEKVSVEELTEQIEQFEDFVQSVDIAAFNKI